MGCIVRLERFPKYEMLGQDYGRKCSGPVAYYAFMESEAR